LRLQAARDHLQIRGELVGGLVGRQVSDGGRRGVQANQCLRGGGEPAVDPGHHAAVGLVAPVRRRVAGARGELEHLGRRVHQAAGKPELAPEEIHLLQVMGEDEPRLLCGGDLQGVRADVRIAVAVTAHPGADGEKRRQPRRARQIEAHAQRLLEVGVEPRQLRNEREPEIGERVHDLVGDGELGQAQHRGKPQPQHLGVQRAIPAGARRLAEEPRDRALALENALALHLGRMRRQHRADACAVKPV
jgi:hypothetical protein